MNKQLRKINTDYFEYTNVNPKNKYTDDCVIRAISTAMENNYIDVYKKLFELSLQTGYMINAEKNYIQYLKQQGAISCKEPRNNLNKKITVMEFIKNNPFMFDDVNVIAHAGSHHLIAIVDGKVKDTWNSSKSIMHRYWLIRKELL